MIAPTLKELRNRPCSLAELQAALVHLIEVHNALNDEIAGLINSGRIRSTEETILNTPYGLSS